MAHISYIFQEKYRLIVIQFKVKVLACIFIPFCWRETAVCFQGSAGQILKVKNTLILFTSTIIVSFNYINLYQEQLNTCKCYNS